VRQNRWRDSIHRFFINNLRRGSKLKAQAQNLAARVSALEAHVATLQSQVTTLQNAVSTRLRFRAGTFTTAPLAPGAEQQVTVTHGLGTDNVLVVLGGFNQVSPSKFEAYWRGPNQSTARFIGPENAILSNVAESSFPASGTVDIFAVNSAAGPATVTVHYVILAL
jgi:hypothetical protein